MRKVHCIKIGIPKNFIVDEVFRNDLLQKKNGDYSIKKEKLLFHFDEPIKEKIRVNGHFIVSIKK